MDQEKPKRRVAVRRNYAPELMAAARAAYEVESLTMPLIAERLGINLHTLKKRAFLESWREVTTLSHPVETAALEPRAVRWQNRQRHVEPPVSAHVEQ